MSAHDLDALACEPLEVQLGGTVYRLMVTVGTMIKVDAARQGRPDSDQWELVMVILEEAGFPREEFVKLNARQATRLSELITGHFFPEAVAAVAASESRSSGQTPSPPSSGTSGEDIH